MPTPSRDPLIVRTEICRIDDAWYILKGCEGRAHHDHNLGDFDTHAQAMEAGELVERAIASTDEHGICLDTAKALLVDNPPLIIKSAA